MLAALQLLASVFSIEVPPNRRAPRGSRALKLTSKPLYQRFSAESVRSTYETARANSGLAA